jgi:hypothetical protein
VLGWPKRCQLAHAFRWGCRCKRLKLAQLLAQVGPEKPCTRLFLSGGGGALMSSMRAVLTHRLNAMAKFSTTCKQHCEDGSHMLGPKIELQFFLKRK